MLESDEVTGRTCADLGTPCAIKILAAIMTNSSGQVVDPSHLDLRSVLQYLTVCSLLSRM